MAEVKDFFLAVYLLAVGEQLTELRVQPEEVFCFADSPTLAGHIEAYRADTARVNPKVFAREIMKLRQQLHKLHQEAR
ncbi:MAG: hypothetical protein KatS3mg131_2496 [Candidatus Tectimicrobiota bacterium]|nr:MAG: hypothetical protein KatS3mg131_2496 [Candidatus Tectomicrobia bacterium]